MTALELANAILLKTENEHKDKRIDCEFGDLYVDFSYSCETREVGDGIKAPRRIQKFYESITIHSIDPLDDENFNGEIPNKIEVEDLFEKMAN